MSIDAIGGMGDPKAARKPSVSDTGAEFCAVRLAGLMPGKPGISPGPYGCIASGGGGLNGIPPYGVCNVGPADMPPCNRVCGGAVGPAGDCAGVAVLPPAPPCPPPPGMKANSCDKSAFCPPPSACDGLPCAPPVICWSIAGAD